MESSFDSIRRRHATSPVAKTMMDRALRVTDLMRRVEQLFPTSEVLSRYSPTRTVRQTYGQIGHQAKCLAGGLQALGIKPGMRVATLMWNHGSHLIAYYAVPGIDAVLHPLNPRLSAEDLAYIIADAGDEILLIDDDLLPLLSEIQRFVRFPTVIVHSLDGNQIHRTRTDDYLDWSDVIAQATPLQQWPENCVDENSAVSICYTSGTTGRPKGVVYSHRSIMLHGLAVATPDALNLSGRDTLLTLTPMFHVNAWSMPYTAVMLGAKQVLAGPRASSQEILDLIVSEHVTAALGVPTVWTDVLAAIDAEPKRWNLPSGMRVYCGGAAPPSQMFRQFDALGIHLQTGWGMTETSPIGSQTWIRPSYDTADSAALLNLRTSSGLPLPLIEMRHVDEFGQAQPWNGIATGELQVRGPWVTETYIGHPSPIKATTDDGWLKTGDMVVFGPDGYMRIVDRLKDLIKSGGEWISSVEMESALCDHPAVSEAAVIAVPDAQWGERPLAILSLKSGVHATAEEIQHHLRGRVQKWMIPDRITFVESLPRTGAGKLNKRALRDKYIN